MAAPSGAYRLLDVLARILHARKETVPFECEVAPPRVKPLVGILVRHTRVVDCLYDLVLAYVENCVSLLAETSPFVTLNRYRSQLGRRIRVKLNTVNQVIWHSRRATDRLKAVVLKGEIDQVCAGHTYALKVRDGRGVALAIVQPQRNELARLPKSEGCPK